MKYKIIAAQTETQLADVRALFEEYRKSLDIDLCFQSYEAELASLPGKYAMPAGRLFVLYAAKTAAACVALRPLELSEPFAVGGENKICEMKRLYVRPVFRGRGFGRLLAQRLLEEARVAGYSVMYLDTLYTMKAAVKLYETLGFERCAAYYDNPDSRAVYMKKILKKV